MVREGCKKTPQNSEKMSLYGTKLTNLKFWDSDWDIRLRKKIKNCFQKVHISREGIEAILEKSPYFDFFLSLPCAVRDGEVL